MESADLPGEDRREFLRRLAGTGAVVLGTGLLGYGLYDPEGPGPTQGNPPEESLTLPNYTMPEAGRRISIVYGEDRIRALQTAVTALGGIEAFIKKGDRVLIKVNAAFAMPPVLGATTHPDLVRETARLCLQAGASYVAVTDNPINDPSSCFALTGIGEAVRSAGAQLILPREKLFSSATLPGGSLIRNWPLLYEPLRGVNKLIGITPVKDHHRSGASMVLKNWYGFLGGRRNVFHQNIHELIKELALLIRPTLVVLDGTTTMMTNGPTGGSLSDLKRTHTLIAGTDPVAVDAFGATLLGRSPRDLPFLLKAEAAGAGTVDFESLQPLRTNLSG
ncbi:MAG TPA: DUF362 domain-containing protein [Syntrophobacteraceae bacterium]|nr:DUF362 domain-containing protein [Syntrophobacteraceae bacterium]